MAVCPRCSAKVVPGDEVCRGCARTLPHALRAEDDLDTFVGRTIDGKYEVLELIGEGAMGRVYEARHLALDKGIAIKVLHTHLANDPKVKKRFHREARAASRLNHPNSLHVIDFGEDDDGTLYIAMELLDGDDLLAVIEEDAPLSPRRIYELMRQVLSALDSAHHAGVVHRDLKPENVIVLESRSGEEHVKVCDFGIAKIQEADGGSAITITGFVCGTPEYMAPEQARGEELDQRADLYAAGCMLYQMLTASLPFTAESALGIITKHLTAVPMPPRERKPEWKIPRALERVCLHAMRKDRDERYPDAPSMSEALKLAVRSLGDDADLPLGSFEAQGEEEHARDEDEDGDDEELPDRGFVWAALLVLLGAAAIGLALYSADGQSTTENVPRSATPPLAGDATAGLLGGAGSDDGGTLPDDAAAPDADRAGDAAATAVADGAAASSDGGGSDVRDSAPIRVRRPDRVRRPTMDADPPGDPSQSPGQVAYREGRELFLANDLRGAISRYETAARLMPRNSQVQKELGRTYTRIGEVSRGRDAYRRYLELNPNAPDRAIIERQIGLGQ